MFGLSPVLLFGCIVKSCVADKLLCCKQLQYNRSERALAHTRNLHCLPVEDRHACAAHYYVVSWFAWCL